MFFSNESPIHGFTLGLRRRDSRVIEQFVVREGERSVLRELLDQNLKTPSSQHAVIIAPRGYGKTMLLDCIAADIRTDPKFADRLLPVIFTQDDNEIFNITDFWLETLAHLARDCADHDSQLAEDLLERHAKLAERWRDDQVAEDAQQAVCKAADRLGRKLVLMIENLNAMCNDCDEDFVRQLRCTLETKPQVILLASARGALSALDKVDPSFVELFRRIDLDPLTTDECRRLWNAIQGEDVTTHEIDPIQVLTGGNPRLVTRMTNIAKFRPLSHLFNDLAVLIDAHAESFRRELAAFGKVERRVYLAILDLWKRSTVGEIADRARMDVNIVSTMLGRLIEHGVLIVAGSNDERTYSAREPLLCMNYNLQCGRGGRRKVQSYIRFLSLFYGKETQPSSRPTNMSDVREVCANREVRTDYHGIPLKLLTFLVETRQSVILPEAVIDDTLINIGSERRGQAIDRICYKILDSIDRKAFRTVIRLVDKLTRMMRGKRLLRAGNVLIWALYEKGHAHLELDELRPALMAFKRVITCPCDRSDGLGRLLIASSLTTMGNLNALEGDTESALHHFDKLVSQFGEDEDPSLCRHVSKALYLAGNTLHQQGHIAAAQAAYTQLVERFGDTDDPILKCDVADALEFQALGALRLGDTDAVLLNFEEIVNRLDGETDPRLQIGFVRALIVCEYMKLDSGEMTTLLASCDEFEDQFGSGCSDELRRVITKARMLKADILNDADDIDAAHETYDEVIEGLASTSDISLRNMLSEALILKTALHAEMGDRDEAFSTYCRLARLFPRADHIEVNNRAAAALASEGLDNLKSDSLDSAVTKFGEIVEGYKSSSDPGLRFLMARSLLFRGQALSKKGELARAQMDCRQVAEEFASSDDPYIRAAVCEAFYHLGTMFMTADNPAEAITIFDQIMHHYQACEEPMLQEWCAFALIKKAQALSHVGRPDEVLRTTVDLRERLADLEPGIQTKFEWYGLKFSALACLAQGDTQSALVTFRNMFDALDIADDEMMRDLLAVCVRLIAGGIDETDITDILHNDSQKSTFIIPLLVAARHHDGERPEAFTKTHARAGDLQLPF